MKSHILIELAKTERAIAEGLRSLEEFNQSKLAEAQCNQSRPLLRKIAALRKKQRAFVNRRNRLLRELERPVRVYEEPQ